MNIYTAHGYELKTAKMMWNVLVYNDHVTSFFFASPVFLAHADAVKRMPVPGDIEQVCS